MFTRVFTSAFEKQVLHNLFPQVTYYVRVRIMYALVWYHGLQHCKIVLLAQQQGRVLRPFRLIAIITLLLLSVREARLVYNSSSKANNGQCCSYDD